MKTFLIAVCISILLFASMSFTLASNIVSPANDLAYELLEDNESYKLEVFKDSQYGYADSDGDWISAGAFRITLKSTVQIMGEEVGSFVRGLTAICGFDAIVQSGSIAYRPSGEEFSKMIGTLHIVIADDTTKISKHAYDHLCKSGYKGHSRNSLKWV